jgi:hypothetical protein
LVCKNKACKSFAFVGILNAFVDDVIILKANKQVYVHEQNIWKQMGFKSHFMMITSLTCMQNVETWHMLKEGSTRCQCLKIWWSKPTWYFKTHEMNQPKAKGTIITSATWYMVKICYFCENVVHACAGIVVLEEGKCIVHEQIIEREWDSYRPFIGSICRYASMITLYIKFANLERSTH